jgi:hypothetical protein
MAAVNAVITPVARGSCPRQQGPYTGCSTLAVDEGGGDRAEHPQGNRQDKNEQEEWQYAGHCPVIRGLDNGTTEFTKAGSRYMASTRS